MTLLLTEPFDNLTAWTGTGGTIVTGRTGTCANVAGVTAHQDYTLAPGVRSDTITIGFAYRRTDALTTARDILQLYGDVDTVQHNRLLWTPTTSTLAFTRSSTTIASNAAISFTQNVWYYIEVQAKLHDTTGFVIVRIDGVEKINTTALDTKLGGSGTVYDAVRLTSTGLNTVSQFDDMYLRNDATFQGDPTIPTGVKVNVWNGSAFVKAPAKVWSGSAYADAAAVKVFNGSTFVNAV